MPSSAAHRVEHDRQPRVALARSPDRDDHATAGPQDAAHLGGGACRVGREHQALAAQHDVEAAVGLVDGFEVEHAGGDVVEAERARPRAAAIAVISARRRRATTSPPGATRGAAARPSPPGPARELEHPLARARARPARACASVTDCAARVDVVGVLAPRLRPPPPTCRGRGSRRLRSCPVVVSVPWRLLLTVFSYS